jgi:citrate lyase beta subunit
LPPILARLAEANASFAGKYPGESGRRQPVHTVYGGAHLFRSDTARRLGDLALRSLETYAPNAKAFAEALGLSGQRLDAALYVRVREKLGREPVEDFRLDFEDGYGNRPDAEEDATAVAAAAAVAEGLAAGTLPPFIGIRIKPLSGELAQRAVRTLDLFVSTLLGRASGRLPEHFVVTLPKVVVPEQAAALADLLEGLERRHRLEAGSLKLELMVENPQSLIADDGRSPLPALVAGARGRCVAAHFGVYDFTASLNITASEQRMRHPACDVARQLMQIALAGTGVMLSDGATNVLPVGPHREERAKRLSPRQRAQNREAVFRAWRLHFEDVRHSLANAYYQGWDLHPAQLPSRYAALYSFFFEALDSASERLKSFIQKAGQATLVGDVFDDAATGQALLNFFLRGLTCGAITEAEALATGLTVAELKSRSFVKILEGRRAAP